MSCAVLLGGRFADVQEFCLQPAERPHMVSAELQGGLLADCQECRTATAKRSIREVPSCKRVDLEMLRNRVFRLRKVEICAVQSSKEVDLLLLSNRVFRLRIVQNW